MKSERDLRPSERPADNQTDQIDDAESSADVGEHSRATNSDDLDAVAQRTPSSAARPASCLLTMFLTKSTTLNRMLMSTTAAEQPAATILTRRKLCAERDSADSQPFANDVTHQIDHSESHDVVDEHTRATNSNDLGQARCECRD